MTNPEDLRRDYAKSELIESLAGDDPLHLFHSWFQDALAGNLVEPNAMALATVDTAGKPSVRTVLLKGYQDGGFTFFTNYQSRKAEDLDANPQAALMFWWDKLERQVRIEGRAKKAPAEISDAYFQSRPRGSRIGAWASPQSQVIDGRDALQKLETDTTARFADGEIERPEHWGGYTVKAELIEFWQGRRSRLHDRLRYRHADGGWLRERLAP